MQKPVKNFRSFFALVSSLAGFFLSFSPASSVAGAGWWVVCWMGRILRISKAGALVPSSSVSTPSGTTPFISSDKSISPFSPIICSNCSSMAVRSSSVRPIFFAMPPKGFNPRVLAQGMHSASVFMVLFSILFTYTTAGRLPQRSQSCNFILCILSEEFFFLCIQGFDVVFCMEPVHGDGKEHQSQHQEAKGR